MKQDKELINTIIKEYGNDRYQYIFMKYAIDIEKCRHKKEKSQEEIIKINVAHEIIRGFKIIDKKTGGLVYFEIDNWIAYQLSNLLKFCNKFFIKADKSSIKNIDNILEEFKMLFRNKKKYSNFTMKNLSEAQKCKLNIMLLKLKIELEDWGVYKYKYKDILEKVNCIEKLLYYYKEIKTIEKKRKDNILRARNKLEDAILANNWDAFLTITFDNRKIDRFNKKLLLAEVHKWVNSIKKTKCKDLKYIILPDTHLGNSKKVVDEKGNYAIHFHCLLANISNLKTEGRVIHTENGEKVHYDNQGRKVYSILELDEKFGTSFLTYITSEIDGLCSYFKIRISLENEFRRETGKRYYCSQNLDKCKIEKQYYTKTQIKELKSKIYGNKKNKVYRNLIIFNERTFKQCIEKISVKVDIKSLIIREIVKHLIVSLLFYLFSKYSLKTYCLINNFTSTKDIKT